VVNTRWAGIVRAGYLFLPLMAVACQALGLNAPYRTLIYVNIGLVVILAHREWLRPGSRGTMAAIVAMPLALIVLQLLSGGPNVRDIRHLVAITFLTIGIWQLASVPPSDAKVERRLYLVALIGIVGYAALQSFLVAMTSNHFGTTKNPHYLAQYCLMLIPVATYLFHRSSPALRLLAGTALVALFALLLDTASRPAWLSLLLAAVLALWLRRQILSWWTVVMVAVIGVLYAANVSDFAGRIDDLYANIGTEERVFIWRDTWTAQLAGSAWQWLVGHGIDHFRDAYRHFSTRDFGIDFNTPHNFLLELLYTSGIAGLVVVIAAIASLYRLGLRLYRDTGHASFVLVLLVVLTANLAFVSITVSFFTSHTLMPLAIIAGLLLSLRETLAHDNIPAQAIRSDPAA